MRHSYPGADKTKGFVSPEGLSRTTRTDTPATPRLDQWSLSGAWSFGADAVRLDRADGSITYRFRARDLHLVLGPGADGRPVRFRLALDGQPPGTDRGVDIMPDGDGSVTETRLYPLIRPSGSIAERRFTTQFHDPHVKASTLTFG